MTDINKALTFTPGQFGKVVDMTPEIRQIPMTWGLIGELNLFPETYGTQKGFIIPTYKEADAGAIVDRSYEGGRNTQVQGERGGLTAKIPHFPLDDAIYPADLDGQLAPGVVFEAGMQLETVARLRAAKMEGLVRRHAITKEYARGLALVKGEVYAPSGTLKTTYGNTINMYNEWGITRQTTNLNLAPAVNPKIAVDELYQALQGSAYAGDAIDGYVVLCSPGLFTTITSHPYLADLFTQASNFPQAENFMVGRLNSALGGRYRQFNYGGIVFIEYRGQVAGQPVIPANKGVAFAMGDALGFMQHAPAQLFRTINTTAESMYFWEKLSNDDDKLELKTESNFATILAKPYLVRDVTFTTA